MAEVTYNFVLTCAVEALRERSVRRGLDLSHLNIDEVNSPHALLAHPYPARPAAVTKRALSGRRNKQETNEETRKAVAVNRVGFLCLVSCVSRAPLQQPMQQQQATTLH